MVARKQSVDAVDIIVPPYLHCEMVIKAAAAGKHVYVEKPMVGAHVPSDYLFSQSAPSQASLSAHGLNSPVCFCRPVHSVNVAR